ncbi:hypothetical protein [Micromonospora sp. NPDC048839]
MRADASSPRAHAVHAAAGTRRDQLEQSAEIAPHAFTAATCPVR